MKKAESYGIGWIYRQTKGMRAHLALYTFLILCVTVIMMSMAYFLKAFVDIATGEVEMSLLYVGLSAIAVIGIGGAVTMLVSILQKYIYGRTERGLRMELMSVIFTRRLSEISKQHTGDLLTKLTVDVQAVSECIPNIINNMLGNAVSIVIAITAMFFLDWRMALILLGLTPLLMLTMGIVTPFIQKASETDKENEENNRSLMQESLSRIMLIKAYFMRAKTIQKVCDTYAPKLKSGMRLGKWEGIAMFSGTLVGFSMFMIVMGIGSYFVLRGDTTLGNLIAIVQLINFVVNPIGQFVGAISQVSQSMASSKRIGEIISLPADTDMTGSAPVDALELTAENVSFSYHADGTDTVLKSISASFGKGAVIGLAGQSGSGKSTLLKLLIGLYAPQQGRVSLKHAGGELSGEEIMAQVAYVPPVDYLFSGTVTDNIIMSEASPRSDDIKAAAAGANILGFIESLPDGFDTAIGESGGTVSSGQAQRIAIARAIYKRSPIIVFDEPTANLDADSIEKFQSAVKALAKDKICIIVTHDPSTMSVCDKVYALENGHVRETRGDEVFTAAGQMTA